MRIVLALLIASILFVSGCVAQNQPQQQINQAPGSKQFTVVISHTAYSPSSFEAGKGDMVTFLILAAKGTGPESGFNHNHGITIDEYGINAATASENSPVAVAFVADKPGTFSIYCRTCWDGPFGREHPDIRAALVVK